MVFHQKIIYFVLDDGSVLFFLYPGPYWAGLHLTTVGKSDLMRPDNKSKSAPKYRLNVVW